MNTRPSHEPTRVFPHPRRLWDDPELHPPSIGCHACPLKTWCGGVHTDAGILDCEDLCTCADKSKCDMVCPTNTAAFVARMDEVRGVGFENVSRAKMVSVSNLPLVAPLIEHNAARASTLDEPVIAVSLYDVVNLATGKLHFRTREAFGQRFRVPPDATVIVSGVGKDARVERWWALPNRAEILSDLEAFGVALVTTPNFSVLNDVPRTDNLHAMKRILLAWAEIANAGVAAALHTNARTEHDYSRWTALLRDHPEIGAIAFEFATGCGREGRIEWHVEQLCQLAREVDRPLRLVIRGGGRKLPELVDAFAGVTLLDTEAFSRTHRRRRAFMTEGGKLRWGKFPTPVDAPLDELLSHNVGMVRTNFTHRATGASRIVMPSVTSRPRRAPHTDDEARQPSFLRDLDLPAQARGVAREREGMVVATET